MYFVKSFASFHILPKLCFLRFRELSLNYFVHGIFEALCWSKSIEAVKTTIIRYHFFLISSKLFIVEIGMRVNDFTTFVTSLRVLPRVVLQVWHEISYVMI